MERANTLPWRSADWSLQSEVVSQKLSHRLWPKTAGQGGMYHRPQEKPCFVRAVCCFSASDIDSESIVTGEGEAYPIPETWLLKSTSIFLAGGQHRTDLSALTLEFADSSKSWSTITAALQVRGNRYLLWKWKDFSPSTLFRGRKSFSLSLCLAYSST